MAGDATTGNPSEMLLTIAAGIHTHEPFGWLAAHRPIPWGFAPPLQPIDAYLGLPGIYHCPRQRPCPNHAVETIPPPAVRSGYNQDFTFARLHPTRRSLVT
jgi:hypothetical protein